MILSVMAARVFSVLRNIMIRINIAKNETANLYRGGCYMVREAKENELNELLKLYLYLHEESMPEMTEHLLDA